MSWIRLESPAYWSVFVVAFLGVALWESWSPARRLSTAAGRRWSVHGLVLLAGTAFSIACLRLTPVLAAVAVAGSSWGVLNRPSVPFWIRAGTAFLLLDLLNYALHRLQHSVGFLWRIHQVHHSDPDFDVSTAGRVHPLEVLMLQGGTLGLIVLLAPPPAAVLGLELCACFFSFFEHANASLPARVEKLIRPWVVTPDVHRIHHSVRDQEQLRNLGEIFTWWDRLFGTYQEQPGAGKNNFTVGLRGHESAASLRIPSMLAHPFRAVR